MSRFIHTVASHTNDPTRVPTPPPTSAHDDAIALVQRGAQQLVRCTTLTEGRCVQTLHVGSYDDEAPLLCELHQEYLPALGMAPIGRHHEIYLNDPRRTPPAKLKTVLRQPVAGDQAVPR